LGILFCRTPKRKVMVIGLDRAYADLADVPPTILNTFGIPQTQHMQQRDCILTAARSLDPLGREEAEPR
jgi:hypothetical protein